MITSAARRHAGGLRSLVRGRDVSTSHLRAVCPSSTLASWPIPGATDTQRAETRGRKSPSASCISCCTTRRGMSTRGGGAGGGKGSDLAGPPGVIKGFGRRQKPVDGGNTALGKGFDLMEDDPESRKKIVIGGYDPHGFQLGDGVDVRGSMICMPNSFVLWAPKQLSEITVESLRLLELVIPKIDLLLIGVGERMTARLDPVLVKHLGSKGIRVEQMDTVNACSTFNVLNAEDRRVAAALLQLSPEEESTISK
ncbi:unnamed protein product [Scytosiphon promiscuus]